MVSYTRPICFYKNDVCRNFTNPMRRWLYHYMFAGAVAGGFAYVWAQYSLAAWEAAHHPHRGNRLCSNSMLEMLMLLPFNYFSNACGWISESTYVPESVHRSLIAALMRWYAVDLSDAESDDFATLQEFFTRRWRCGARPIAAAPVTSPADGVVLSVDEDAAGDRLVQVKGVTYSLRNLLHGSAAPVAEGCRRVALVVRLRAEDFHHVIAPCNFNCTESVYVPGALLPNSPAGFHWIPSVLTLNERVVLRGRAEGGGEMALALVGGTLTGRIKLHFDERVRTNYLNPPEYAIHRSYKSKPLFAKGTMLATFQWGSAVVLVVDIPKDASIGVKAGDVVRAGEALITY